MAINVSILFILSNLLIVKAYALDACTQTKAESFKEFDQIASSLENSFSTSLDPNLLRPWSAEAKFQCEPPFKVTYKNGKKEFVFVAVSHISGPVVPDQSDLKILEETIETTKPESVVVETVSGGIMPKVAFEGISKKCFQDKKFFCGESAYSAMIADKVGAKVLGGEPIPPVLNDALLKVESNSNLLAYRSTQTVLSFKRQGVPEKEWPKKFLEDLSHNIDLSKSKWSYDEYSKWLKNHLNLKAKQVEDSWLEPKNDEHATALQRIAYHVDNAREPLIVKNVEQVLNQHNKVMILYGAGHFYKQAPVYEKIFGAPKIECLKK